jgi:hypothetical protein
VRERYLAAIKAAKPFFFNAVVAQAYRIDVTPARITFAFLANQKVPRAQCEENRDWLTALAATTLGQDVPVQVTIVAPAEPGSPAPTAPVSAPAAVPFTPPTPGSDDELRREALSDPGVQALFEIFPVERTKIEEM